MVGNAIAFIELGGIVLAWTIFWNYLLGAFLGNHAGSPAAQGLAAVYQS